MRIQASNANVPNWREISVRSSVPAALEPLDEIAHNLWWAWNNEVGHIFNDMDTKLWHEVQKNPVLFLGRMNYEKLEQVAADKKLVERINNVYKEFRAYMDVKPDAKRPSVAYLCMEYGLNNVLKIYSGGLGILAGDYVKEASDSNIDFCAVGFLYRYGYFTQTLSMEGQQVANYEAQVFPTLPIERELDAEGNQVVIDVPYNNYTVHALVWRVNVGRVKLYLLDTDNDMNSEYDRSITHALYGGDWENRLKQEILLGIGGVLLLNKLGIKKDIIHCNEGHAALANVQRLVEYVESGLTFNEALEVVRTSSLYTVHTPVPAGHDYFDEGLFGKYMGQYPEKLGISWDDFMGMGRVNPDDKGERFCMSTFACNTSSWVNGVSWLHGKVSKEMFNGIWKGYFPEELDNVGYVTNGVHMPTWTASEWKAVYAKNFDKNFLHDQSNEKIWEAIYNVPDQEIWNTRLALKAKLIEYIKKAFKEDWLKHQGDPSRIVSIVEKINPNALTIGFARRFATYKRAHLLFSDLDRLAKIVNNPNYPVQFLFAGKAHPADGAGQGLIKKIYEISRRPEFLGKIIFLENYDMKLARRLVTGVDIWMNTPTRPLEASGTSGEKALMNGVVNLSVLDGWWLEGYREGAGWALTDKRTFQNQSLQDQLDAETIYTMLETEIVPLYFAKNRKGYSPDWVKAIKDCLCKITPHFTMRRQLDDYYDRFYTKEGARGRKLAANGYKLAKEIAAWKLVVAENWDSIEVKEVELPQEEFVQGLSIGKTYKATVVVDGKAIANDLGLDLVIADTGDGAARNTKSYEMEVVKREGTLVTFTIDFPVKYAGAYKIGFRLFPKNENLPHRMDFAYTRWF